MAALSLRNVHKQFGNLEIIKGIDLDVADGEFVVFVGPSGCGKSTLLRMIAGLEDISDGEVWIGDTAANDLPPARRGIAMVFQSYALYPHMTVYQNMAFGLKLAGTPGADIDAKVRAAAKALHLEPLLERKPRALSGGQRQRVAIGRAIVRNPKAFLFDEPLSNLDASLRVQMRVEIAKLHQDLGATMIYVTHDQVEAMTLADRICILNGGRVEQYGSPLDLYHNPANLFVAGFIGSPKMNILDATVAAVTADGVSVRGSGALEVTVPVDPQGVRPGDRVSLGIRPEHVRIGDTATRGAGRVELVERLGSETLVHLGLGDGMAFIAQGPGDLRVTVGDDLPFGFAPAEAHLFATDGSALRRAGPKLHA